MGDDVGGEEFRRIQEIRSASSFGDIEVGDDDAARDVGFDGDDDVIEGVRSRVVDFGRCSHQTRTGGRRYLLLLLLI